MLTRFKRFITGLFRLPALEAFLVMPLVRHSRYNRWINRKIAPRPFQYPPDTRRLATRRGIRYELYLHQHIDYSIYFGLTDDATRRKLYSLALLGDTVLDVGTNIGEVLMNFAHLVGADGKVYGFEPNPLALKRLHKNLSLNQFSNYEIVPLGLSHQRQQHTMYEIASDNIGINRILPELPTTGGDAIHIETVPLDEWVAERNIGKIDLIKIDVEGFEWAVLEGAVHTLTQQRPVLFLELVDAYLLPHQKTARMVVDFLNKYHYDCFRADNDVAIDQNYPLDNCVLDIYAIPK